MNARDRDHDAIAIVGMGGRFPGSPDLGAYWDTIRTAKVCATPVPLERWKHENFYSPNGARMANHTYASKAARIDDARHFAPDFFGLTPRRAKVMDPQQRLFLDAVRTALEDAGYANRPFPRARTGVFVGSTVSDFMDILTARVRAWQLLGGEFGTQPPLDADERTAVTGELAPMQAYSMVGSLMNMVAANVSQCFDLGGPSFTMDAACSSALVALHEAVWQLRVGLCDAAVVGGVYLFFTPDNFVAFARIGALSHTDVCRPYDKKADGFVIGEGVGAVILRRLSDAVQAGDRIYAVIRGIAANSDGKAEGPMTPRREGQLISLEQAYADAGVPAHTIDFLEGHGTATPVGDATEIAAFRDVLGGQRGNCAVSSVKANIGHSMSAAGIAGLIKASLTLLHRQIPPQASYDEPRPELELEQSGLYVPRELRDWASPLDHPRRAGVNAFGFGGTNVHVVLEEPPGGHRRRASVSVPARIAPATGEAPRAELVVLSAPTPALLKTAARQLAASLADLEPGVGLADVAFTLGQRRVDQARLALVVRDLDELGAGLREAAGDGTGIVQAAAPRAAEDRRAVFMFPGQGLQTPGLCRDLYDRFPGFRLELERLTAAVTGLPRPLLSYLYPDEDGADAAAALTATEVCQPAVAALSLALARFVRKLGLAPDLVVGHSLGEFAAAAAGGLIADDAACVRFVAERGRLIAAHPGETGTMSAVASDVATIEKTLAGVGDVVLANLNHPRQVVISGTVAGVAEAERRLAEAGVRTTRLRVSHAFHSPLMASVAEGLAPAVASLPLAPAVVPVVSAIRAALYNDEPAAIRHVFLEHATAQVDWAAAVGVCAAQGARVFIQMGAGSALTSMAAATLAGGDTNPAPIFMTLAASTPDGGASFLRALAELFVAGAPLELAGLHEGEATQLVTMIPPSLLESRPLWPVARRDTLSRAETAAESPAPPSDLVTPIEEPMDPKPTNTVIPAAPAAASPAADNGLAGLFRQQIAVLDAHLAIIKQQNDLLARGGGATPPQPMIAAPPLEALAPPSNGHTVNGNGHARVESNGNGHVAATRINRPIAPVQQARESNGRAVEAPRVEPPAPSGPSPAELESKIIEVVSRITAHPPDKLNPGIRLGGDLGFDSLMVVELVSGLQEAVPGSEPLPRTLFAEDVTIADIARHLHRSVGKGGAAPVRKPAPRAVTRSDDLRRYGVVFEPRAVAAAGACLALPPVVILADQSGVAEVLRRRLERRNVVARIADSVPGDLPAGATVIDLRALGDGTGHGHFPAAAAFSSATAAAFELCHRIDGVRPATLLFAHRGLSTGGVAGLAKALGREWSETRVLAVEMELGGAAETIAERLEAELGGGETHAEVRYEGAERLVPVLRAAPLAPPPALPDGAVVVVSGGGAGLGARLARTLASTCHARLILLGRSAPGPASEALAVEIRRAGGDALYLSCDVRDQAVVSAALAQGRQAFGPIAYAVHAAGLVEDAPVGRKQADGFARVFDTKVAGALALWNALGEDPLSGFVLYGSWAGRFGNAHQIDYSAGNHVLGRLAEALPRLRPGVRVSTLDLPPWEGSTMLRGVPEAVRAEMRTRGVTFLSDEVGLERVVAELAGAPSGEALLGAHVPQRTIPVALRSRLSVQAQPYLDDHRIGDRPVLPMAAAVDLMLAAARGAGVRGPITSVQELAVVKGVILANGTGDVIARATVEDRGGEAAEAATELLSLGAGGRAAVSYRARVTRPAGWLEPVALSSDIETPTLSLAEFYARHTFHGPRLRSVEEIMAVGAGHIEGRIASGGDDSTTWLLAVDGALQLCAYWAVMHHGRIGLPVGAAEVRLGAPVPTGARLICRAALRGSEGDRFDGDLDLLTEAGEPVVQIRGLRAELVVGVESPVVESSRYRIEEFAEVKELQTKLEFARAAGIDIPYFRTLDACTGATALIEGREYINFTSYNYVGLSGHPRIAEAVTQAVNHYGTSVSASRVTGGQKPIHAELEQALAQFLGTESALVMVGGHATNVSVIGHMLGAEDLVLHDALAHDSILGGAKLAGARRRPFPHNDHEALERILREVRSSVRRVLIAVEGVYSMDGDVSPLPQIIALKKKYGAMLFVDEAHSLGVLGRTGRGVGEHYGVDRRDVEVWMGTMSKTLASCGGYIAGSAVLTEYLKYTVPGFIYSVGMSPANAAAALCALRILNAEPERARTCQDRARFFLSLCHERGIDTGLSEHSSVVPCIVGNSYAAIRLAEGLLKRGIHVHPIIYPAVSETMARLRFFITAAHTEDQLRITADALADELVKLQLLPSAGVAVDDAEALPARGAPGEVS